MLPITLTNLSHTPKIGVYRKVWIIQHRPDYQRFIKNMKVIYS